MGLMMVRLGFLVVFFFELEAAVVFVVHVQSTWGKVPNAGEDTTKMQGVKNLYAFRNPSGGYASFGFNKNGFGEIFGRCRKPVSVV